MFLLNHVVCNSLNYETLHSRLTGQQTDISPLLCFCWWEPVCYKLNESQFPSNTREGRGHFVGISENVGHVMTFEVLSDDTKRVIHRSVLHSAVHIQSQGPLNLRLDPLKGGGISPPPKPHPQIST